MRGCVSLFACGHNRARSHRGTTPPLTASLLAPPQEQRYGAGEGEDEDASDGMDAEGPGGGGGAASLGYTEAELLQRVQCSAAELREALQERKTFCRGAWLGWEAMPQRGCQPPQPCCCRGRARLLARKQLCASERLPATHPPLVPSHPSTPTTRTLLRACAQLVHTLTLKCPL